jgi:DNA invertase Pin-like site-specific DNA recombinase
MHNVDAVLQVSVSANQAIYEKVKEDVTMCEALQKLLKDEINEKVAAGMAAGMAQGRTEGMAAGMAEGKTAGKMEQAISTAYTLADMGMTTDKIAEAVHYGIDTVTKWLEERTGKSSTANN